MKLTGIQQQQQTTTVQQSQLEVESEALELLMPMEKAQPDTLQQMKSLQQNANERKADARMDGQLRQMQLEGSLRSKESVDSEIKERLSLSLSNLMITKSDVDSVHSKLQKLSPGDFQKTINGLHKEGLLNRYINHLDDDGLRVFLQKAVDSGYIKSEPAPEGTPGKFNPPNVPSLLINDRHLPTEVREAIHEENLNNVCRYYRSYGEYMDRYSAAVLQAKSGEEIRAIGPPVDRKNMSEPGVIKSRGEIDYSRFTKDWYGTLAGFPTEGRAYQAISDRMHDLTGAKRAGSLWFTSEFQVGLEQKLGQDTKMGANAKGRLELSSYGGTSTQTEASTQMSSDFAGIQFKDGVGKTVTTAPGGISFESDIQPTSETGLEFGQKCFSVQNDGTVEGSFSFSEAPHGFAKFNPKDGYMELGVGKSVESGLAKAQIRLGIGFQGSSPERAVDAATGDVGTFGTPPELERGMSWKALPDQRRGYFERSLGWNETEWNKRLAVQQK